MDLDFRMHAERTPNPQSIKWVISKEIVPAGATQANFKAPMGSELSPLAARLFAVPGIESVFLASHFVTVTKREELVWTDVAQGVVDAIKAHVASGEAALGPAFDPESDAPAELTFVDDKVDHLDDVAPLGARCVLAAWGFNGPREHALARARGSLVSDLESFEAQVF